MRWATRRHCHVDRAACAWLIRRFIDPEATLVFVDDSDDTPPDATGFDIRGVDLTHHDEDCSFETSLRSYELQDEALAAIARVAHEADLGDDRFERSRPQGSNAVVRAVSRSSTTRRGAGSDLATLRRSVRILPPWRHGPMVGDNSARSWHTSNRPLRPCPGSDPCASTHNRRCRRQRVVGANRKLGEPSSRRDGVRDRPPGRARGADPDCRTEPDQARQCPPRIVQSGSVPKVRNRSVAVMRPRARSRCCRA